MDNQLAVDGLKLATHLARPPGTGPAPALVLTHDFPVPPRGALASGLTFPELADRIARDAGWIVFTFNLRGTGGSDGDFSISGWLADQRAAIDHLQARDDVLGIWLVGTGVGGSLSLVSAARDERVRGVATLGAQSTLREWTRDPNRFLKHCRQMGVFRTPGFPFDAGTWIREIEAVDAPAAARLVAPRPLLVLQGTEDDVASVEDARAIADAHGAADLRIVQTAARRLRHDPRAIASLLGWLDRQEV